ncbi:MAG: hypothetical protein R3Y24_11885 [Eubacteriales bacterium]
MLEKHSIFYALYFGGVRPWEESKLPLSKEYRKLTKTSCDMQEKILAQLGGEGKQLFEDYLKLNNEISGHFEVEKFKEGFILGTRLMVETFTDRRYDEQGV